MRTINLRLTEETLDRIDTARGSVPRERWIRDVIMAEFRAPRWKSSEWPPGSYAPGSLQPPPRSTWPEGWQEQPLIVQGVTHVTSDGHTITIVDDPVKAERVEPSVPPSLPVKRKRKGPLPKAAAVADPPKPGYVRNTPPPAPKLGELPSGPAVRVVPGSGLPPGVKTHPFKQGPRQGRCECGQPQFAPVHG